MDELKFFTKLDHPNCHYLLGAKTTLDNGGILVGRGGWRVVVVGGLRGYGNIVAERELETEGLLVGGREEQLALFSLFPQLVTLISSMSHHFSNHNCIINI